MCDINKFCGYIRVPFCVKTCDLDTFKNEELPIGWEVHEHYLTPIANILVFEVKEIKSLQNDIRCVEKLISIKEGLKP